MNAKLKILIRTINRRIANGEQLEDILIDYPLLTDEEKEVIRGVERE